MSCTYGIIVSVITLLIRSCQDILESEIKVEDNARV